jgi:hypothetical protein
MFRAMETLLFAALELAARPVALIGYILLGVWARSALRAVGYAVAWAFALQLFATVTGAGFGSDPAALAVQLGLRAAGAVVLTLAVFLLYRALRHGAGPNPGSGSSGRGGGKAMPDRPRHLRRVK